MILQTAVALARIWPRIRNVAHDDAGTGVGAPRWRGVTLAAELARGLSVAIAGDNCRDAWFVGDHDM